MGTTLEERLEQSASFIKEHLNELSPKVAITLGSGLGDFANSLENKISLPYSSIPGFQKTNVFGHAGHLICGKINNGKQSKEILVLQGRIHAYEGHSFQDVVFPTRVVKTLGIENLILTNASGGMNPNYQEGDLVLIKDHINLTGDNPLKGENYDFLGPRFPDMTETYNKSLQSIIWKAAESISFKLKEGTYVGVLGPSYETPAEIRMYQSLGGDLVGMSTVAEAIAAHHCGLKVAGISCVTNLAAGISKNKLDHGNIKNEANKVKDVFTDLLKATISLI